ncbi:hypothetical protein [Stappia sediminis]|nr:hypothetical protein [Stappia sediminis]
MDGDGGKKKAQQKANAEKEKRLSEALRANLRRRKAAKKPGSIEFGGVREDSTGEDSDD